jgi:hypothetical protein
VIRVFDGFKFGVGFWFAKMIVEGLVQFVIGLVHH